MASLISRGPDRRRRKTLKAYNVLGDVAEYEATLQSVEKPREATPPPESFDLSCVPADILAAMDSDNAVYKPILEAYKGILAERKALADEHARVMALSHATSSTAPPHDLASLEATRDSRTLSKHQVLEETWASQSVTLAAKYGKQPADTALARAFTFRKRREKLDHIHKSKPVHERLASDVFWQISLREAYSRYLRVGHEFTGLYVEAEEKPPEQMRVPLEIFGKPAAFDPSRGPVAAALIERLGLRRRRLLRSQEEKGRAWLQGSYLRSVERKYRKPMKDMMAHLPEMDKLAVLGASATDSLAAQAARPISLQEVLARLADSQPDAAERYAAVAQQARQREAAAAAAALREAEEALGSQHAAAGPAGPALRFSTERLALRCEVGKVASATVRVRGVGTAAVRFRWSSTTPALPVPGAERAGAGGGGAEGGAPGGGGAPASPFLMCRRAGAVLPGQELEFEFLFRPRREGMYTEVWSMEVEPALTDGFAVPPVTLRGVAITHDSNTLRRRRLRRGLLESQSRREATAVLERLLRDMAPAAATLPDLPPHLDAEHASFAAAVAGEEPPLFFRDGLGRRLAAADARAREVVDLMGDSAGVKGKKGSAGVPPEEVTQALAEHDGSLVSLQRLLATIKQHALDAATADAGELLARELAAIRSDAAAPDHQTVLHTHAVRKVMLAVADALDSAAAMALQAAVDSSERRRAAEAEAAVLEGQLSDAAATPPPPAGGQKGKADKRAAPPEPPQPQYDADVYRDLLYRGFRESLRRCLNGFEAGVEETLVHVGAVLDARIDDVQALPAAPAPARDTAATDDVAAGAPLEVAGDDAPPEGACVEEGAAEERAWTVFSLLRQRLALEVRSLPAAVVERAEPLRRPALDFEACVRGVRRGGCGEGPLEDGRMVGDGGGEDVGGGGRTGSSLGDGESDAGPGGADTPGGEAVRAHEAAQAT